ncbi:MAG: hypothetical protein WDA60_12600 [Acidimicrobiia bacterium]|jgi:hypothetical protein
MFRIIRRAPWIALGAAAAYLLDGENGAARRRHLADATRSLAEQLETSYRSALADRTARSGAHDDDEPLVPTVSATNVETRGAAVLPEEAAAGVSDDASPAMAAQILEESEQRVTDRAGSADERRRSEDTVAPVAG